MSLFAPNVNSYRRTTPHNSAPINVQWGYDNRTAGLRVPMSSPVARRVENRCGGADANPYLALYTLLRTGLEGPIEHNVDAETRRNRTKFLPDNIYDAIRLFKSSKFQTISA